MGPPPIAQQPFQIYFPSSTFHNSYLTAISFQDSHLNPEALPLSQEKEYSLISS